MQTNPSEPTSLICGAPLRYTDHAEEMDCSICHRHFSSNAQCENGHFVCDECHRAPALGAVRHICLTTTAKNPYEIAVAMMDHPAVHPHGPERHVLAGAALLAAYHNAGGSVDLPAALNEMVRRGSMVPG